MHADPTTSAIKAALRRSRGASYVRVSSSKQEDKKSDHEQFEAIERWHTANSLKAEAFGDTGQRHRSERREDFQRLAAAIEAGEYQWLILRDLDRLGFRNAY